MKMARPVEELGRELFPDVHIGQADFAATVLMALGTIARLESERTRDCFHAESIISSGAFPACGFAWTKIAPNWRMMSEAAYAARCTVNLANAANAELESMNSLLADSVELDTHARTPMMLIAHPLSGLNRANGFG